MKNRSRNDGSAEPRAATHATDLRLLRSWEHEAERGKKLPGNDRLKAARLLGRAWRSANAAGATKEDFQDEVFAKLKRGHARREGFKLANWILPKNVEEITREVADTYANKREPLKALEPYLVAVAVAAVRCGANPDDWKMDLLRDLSIWRRPVAAPGVDVADDRPAETLALLLNDRCRMLGRRNQLDRVFRVIASMSCRWEMFDELLLPTDSACMQRIESPISPIYEPGLYFEEMFPFPSVALLNVPYLAGEAAFTLAPEELLRPAKEPDDDAELAVTGETEIDVLAAMRELEGAQSRLHDPIPADATGRLELIGEFVYFRELRLCVVPDGHGDFAAALESRPRLEVTFPEDTPVAGTHHVHGGYEPDVSRGLFYARHPDGGGVWPTIKSGDGRQWRIRTTSSFWTDSTFIEREPETCGWQFDADPVGAPGLAQAEPWYLSYTAAKPVYLKHWLTRPWSLGQVLDVCPWSRTNFDWEASDGRYGRDLPPIHQLHFPDVSNATWIECCLHNGLIEEALQASIARLVEQTATLQRNWQSDRDTHVQRLLNRWHVTDHEEL